MMMTFIEVKSHQRSLCGKQCAMATKLVVFVFVFVCLFVLIFLFLFVFVLFLFLFLYVCLFVCFLFVCFSFCFFFLSVCLFICFVLFFCCNPSLKLRRKWKKGTRYYYTSFSKNKWKSDWQKWLPFSAVHPHTPGATCISGWISSS